MEGPAAKERTAMLIMAGGLLASLGLYHASKPAERDAPEMAVARHDPMADGDAASPKSTSHERARCRKRIAKAEQEGLVRERPSSERVGVDDERWHRLDTDARMLLMRSLACDAWRGAAVPDGAAIVAYSWSSGRRLATLSGVKGR